MIAATVPTIAQPRFFTVDRLATAALLMRVWDVLLTEIATYSENTKNATHGVLFVTSLMLALGPLL